MSLEEIESGARRVFGSFVRVMCLLFRLSRLNFGW